jgi:TusA-related sulfurtransferase
VQRLRRGGGAAGGRRGGRVNVRSSVDVRALACPMTWVRTRIALDALAPGEALEVLLREGEPLESLPRTAELEGHAVAARDRLPEQGAWRVVLVKGRAPADPLGEI